MTKELSQLDRAVRFAIRVRANPGDDTVILKGEDLLDAKALAEEFERLLEKVSRGDEARRRNAKFAGRPPLKRPNAAALAKRKSRARHKQEKPE